VKFDGNFAEKSQKYGVIPFDSIYVDASDFVPTLLGAKSQSANVTVGILNPKTFQLEEYVYNIPEGSGMKVVGLEQSAVNKMNKRLVFDRLDVWVNAV
jgi:hypothetical protein